MNCLIVGNGNIAEPEWLSRLAKSFQADCVIAADGGYDHLLKAGIDADILIGDLDSIENLPERENLEIIVFPKDKDFTDLELAISHALKIKADTILLTGVTGTRLDHSLANIFLLRKLSDSKTKIEIADEHHRIFIIKRQRTFTNCKGSLLSLLPLDPVVEGVCLQGFQYPLHNAVLEMGATIGISNLMVSDDCEITIKSGLLLGIMADPSL